MKNVLLAVLAVAVLAGGFTVARASGGASNAQPLPLPSASARPPRAVIFGDSIVLGTAAPAGKPTMATTAAADLGWDAIVKGFGGTGYTTGGELKGQPYTVRVENELIGAQVDVIVVEGGTNDLTASDSALRAAANKVLDRLKATTKAKVVVMGPYYPTTPPDPKSAHVRDVLRSVAVARSLPFIDQLGWITATDSDQYVTSEDHFHPNAAGQVYLGHRLSAALRTVFPSGPPRNPDAH